MTETTRRVSILHVGKYYPPHKGGIEATMELLCRGMTSWAKVSALVANDGCERLSERLDDVLVTRLATWATLSSTPICPGLFGELRRSRADIIHIHAPNPLGILAYLFSGIQTPLVVTYNGDILRQKLLKIGYLPLERLVFKRAAALVATSPDYLEFSPVLQAHKNRCRVIPFGIPHEKYLSPDLGQVEALRRRYGDRIILSVGRLVYYKGFEHLLAAMADVNAQLLIIGEGPLRFKLEKSAADAGVSERVHFLGEVPDVLPYYHAADVFVLASTERTESFGVVQLEAMACGKPVVNTNIATGVPFVSRNDVTGLTVPPGDAPALARALATLLDDPELRREYGSSAQRRVREEFGLELMLRRYRELYSEIVRP